MTPGKLLPDKNQVEKEGEEGGVRRGGGQVEQEGCGGSSGMR